MVAIQGDHAHGPDGAAAEGGAQTGIDVAHHRAEHPSLEVQIDAHHGRVGDHDAEVGDGQVNDQQVGGSAQRLGGGENVDHHAISAPGNHANDDHVGGQDFGPDGVHGGELVPVRADQVRHIGGHLVHHRSIGQGGKVGPQLCGCCCEAATSNQNIILNLSMDPENILNGSYLSIVSKFLAASLYPACITLST